MRENKTIALKKVIVPLQFLLLLLSFPLLPVDPARGAANPSIDTKRVKRCNTVIVRGKKKRRCRWVRVRRRTTAMSSEGDKNLVIDALAKTAKPRPRFDTNWPCPPEGDATPVSHSDIDLNRLKNGIDSGDFTEFALEDVIGLGKPVGVCGKKRSAWTSAQTAAIDANEGRPVTVEGFLALVKNGTTLEGGRKEGPESCNCHGQENAIA